MTTPTNAAGNGSARNALRAKLLDKKTTAAQSRTMTLFGQEIELRQPSLKVILTVREMEDPAARAAHMIIRYACVPGTDERIFEEGDIPQILNWAFGPDVAKFNEIIGELTGLDLTEMKEGLRKDPLPEGSSSSPVS